MAGLYYLMLSLSLILLLYAMLGKECQIICSGNIISSSSRLLIMTGNIFNKLELCWAGVNIQAKNGTILTSFEFSLHPASATISLNIFHVSQPRNCVFTIYFFFSRLINYMLLLRLYLGN